MLARRRPAVGGSTSVGLADYVDEIVRSGLPGLRIYRGRALRAQLNGYLDRIVDTDFEDQGLSVRCPETLRRWIAAYAAEARLRHLRLHGGGREVDLIVERNDQRIIASASSPSR